MNAVGIRTTIIVIAPDLLAPNAILPAPSRLVVDVLLAQVGPSRLDERVQLGEEGDGPHQVAADDGEDDGRAPEAGWRHC